MPLHDPLAAAVALDPSLVECFDLPMKVETQTGDFHGTRGRTVGDPAGLIDPAEIRVDFVQNNTPQRRGTRACSNRYAKTWALSKSL